MYREIAAPERLVFVVSFSDKERNTLRHFASATWPLEVLNAVTFTEQGGKTKLTVQARVLSTTAVGATYLEGQEPGWSQSLDRLDEFLRRKS